jgi:hypothetical protein
LNSLAFPLAVNDFHFQEHKFIFMAAKQHTFRNISDYVALGVGAVFYVGDCDLNWIVNDESYNHVDYMVDEIGNLFCDINGTNS